MWMIVSDMEITRRKRLNTVIDEDDVLQFSAPRLGDCLRWLIEMEQSRVLIHCPDGEYYLLEFSRWSPDHALEPDTLPFDRL